MFWDSLHHQGSGYVSEMDFEVIQVTLEAPYSTGRFLGVGRHVVGAFCQVIPTLARSSALRMDPKP